MSMTAKYHRQLLSVAVTALVCIIFGAILAAAAAAEQAGEAPETTEPNIPSFQYKRRMLGALFPKIALSEKENKALTEGSRRGSQDTSLPGNTTTTPSSISGSHTLFGSMGTSATANFFRSNLKLVNSQNLVKKCPCGKYCANPEELFYSNKISTRFPAVSQLEVTDDCSPLSRINSLWAVDNNPNLKKPVVAVGGEFFGNIRVPLVKKGEKTLSSGNGDSPTLAGIVGSVNRDSALYRWALKAGSIVTGVSVDKVGNVAAVGIVLDTTVELPFIGFEATSTVFESTDDDPRSNGVNAITSNIRSALQGYNLGNNRAHAFLAIYDQRGRLKSVTLMREAAALGVDHAPDGTIVMTGAVEDEPVVIVRCTAESCENGVTLQQPCQSQLGLNAFVSKFSKRGEHQWTSFNRFPSFGWDVTVSRKGAIVATGMTKGLAWFSTNHNLAGSTAYCGDLTNLTPPINAYVTQISPNGRTIWSDTMRVEDEVDDDNGGERGYATGLGVAVDCQENVYVAGFFMASLDSVSDATTITLGRCVGENPGIGCTTLTSPGGRTQGFMASYNSYGTLRYAARGQGQGLPEGVEGPINSFNFFGSEFTSIAVDCRSERVFVTGAYHGPASFPSAQPAIVDEDYTDRTFAYLSNHGLGITSDAAVVTYRAKDGRVIDAQGIGGRFFDFGLGIVADNTCGYIVVGRLGPRGAQVGNRFFDSEGWCPSGFIARAEDCIRCKPGHYVDTACRKCVPCSGNTFSSKLSTKCKRCPAGTTVSSCGTRCEEQASCPAGQEPSGKGGSCRKCQSGTWKPNAGPGVCKLCPRGTFSKRGAKRCRACPHGFSSTWGSSHCFHKKKKKGVHHEKKPCGCNDKTGNTCDKCSGKK